MRLIHFPIFGNTFFCEKLLAINPTCPVGNFIKLLSELEIRLFREHCIQKKPDGQIQPQHLKREL